MILSSASLPLSRTRDQRRLLSHRIHDSCVTIVGITVERCGNNPPKFLEINITEDGKAKGKDTVEKEIVAAMKKAGEDAKKGRAEAQKNMVRCFTYGFRSFCV